MTQVGGSSAVHECVIRYVWRVPQMGSTTLNEVICEGEGVDVKVEPDALIYGVKAASRE